MHIDYFRFFCTMLCTQAVKAITADTIRQSSKSIPRPRVLRSELKERAELWVSFWVVKSPDSHFSLAKAEHYGEDAQEQEAEANQHYNHLHLSIGYRPNTDQSISNLSHLIAVKSAPIMLFCFRGLMRFKGIVHPKWQCNENYPTICSPQFTILVFMTYFSVRRLE